MVNVLLLVIYCFIVNRRVTSLANSTALDVIVSGYPNHGFN